MKEALCLLPLEVRRVVEREEGGTKEKEKSCLLGYGPPSTSVTFFPSLLSPSSPMFLILYLQLSFSDSSSKYTFSILDFLFSRPAEGKTPAAKLHSHPTQLPRRPIYTSRHFLNYMTQVVGNTLSQTSHLVQQQQQQN